jgi:hypothetical protein
MHLCIYRVAKAEAYSGDRLATEGLEEAVVASAAADRS